MTLLGRSCTALCTVCPPVHAFAHARTHAQHTHAQHTHTHTCTHAHAHAPAYSHTPQVWKYIRELVDALTRRTAELEEDNNRLEVELELLRKQVGGAWELGPRNRAVVMLVVLTFMSRDGVDLAIAGPGYMYVWRGSPSSKMTLLVTF